MARGLSVLFGAAPRRGRRAAWFALVLVVVGVHSCVTDTVAERMAAVDADSAMPARIEVTYVREMALSAPPPTAAPAAPPPPVVAIPTAPRTRKAMPAKPASAPEPGPAAAEPVLAAASEPAVAKPDAGVEPRVAAASSTTEPAAIAAAAAAASAPASGAGRPFEWPASTRMTYLLTGNYRGAVSGSAQVEWIRSGSHYQVHVDFVVGPTFAPLITQRSSSDGEITAAGLAPRRYDQDIRLLTSTRPRQTVLFDAGNVILATGEVLPAPPGMQDTASQFVQLTYLFSTRPELLRVGGRVDIPLALPKKVDTWVYDVVEEQTLTTPLGPVQALHLKPRNERRPGTLRVEMWFAPQLNYLPARLRFEQDGDNYVDLMISKPPELAK
jgi:hypothetical protein